jgi:predicted RNase H-like nuclease (RuvC/YqgF family)
MSLREDLNSLRAELESNAIQQRHVVITEEQNNSLMIQFLELEKENAELKEVLKEVEKILKEDKTFEGMMNVAQVIIDFRNKWRVTRDE